MARMGQPRAWMSGQARAAAATNAAIPRPITTRGGSKPEAVARRGPMRAAVSAPLRASMASLKKLEAIWMARALPRVQMARAGDHAPLDFHASTHPSHTGTMAAGRVFGRVARIMARIIRLHYAARGDCQCRMRTRHRRGGPGPMSGGGT